MSFENFYNDFNMLERIKPILTEERVNTFTPEFIQENLGMIVKEFFELLAKSINYTMEYSERKLIEDSLSKGSIISLEQFKEVFNSMSETFKLKVGDVDTSRLPKTIRELVSWPVERSEYTWWDIQFIASHSMNFFPRVDECANFDEESFDADARIQINYLKDYCFDGRRTYTWAYITLDEEPKMIFYRAGRDGMDYKGFYSIGNGWQELNDVLVSYCEFDEHDTIARVELDEEITDGFTEVYGYNLLSEFKPWD